MDPSIKTGRYDRIYRQLAELLEETESRITRMATMADVRGLERIVGLI